MRSVAAANAKLNFGQLLETAQREPVTITKKDRPVAVIVSQVEYDRLMALEDAIWAERADAVLKKSAPIGTDETAKFIEETLKRAGS